MLMSKTTTAGIMLLLALLMQGCGRKAPLFLPQVPAKPVPAATVQPEPAQAAPSQTIPSQPESNY